MSFDVKWDIESHREEHESDEHWHLRKRFMERWKTDYPEQRLVCLARVFANIELLGCRYPTEVMQEVARLSYDIAQNYRKSRKDKLQRTFVSASTAAEDRARGIKREGGIVIDVPPSKSTKISFVPQGFVAANVTNDTQAISDSNSDSDNDRSGIGNVDSNNDRLKTDEKKSSQVIDANDYLKDMLKVKCLNIEYFHDGMFITAFGRMVLLIRPWTNKLSNIQSSCQSCNLILSSSYENNCFSLSINGKLLAQATGSSRPEAKSIVETMAWNRLREEMICVIIREQWIAHGDRVSVNDVSGVKEPDFGAPVENSIAAKMMQMMGWRGGGLGADAQGIAEPIKPKLQIVNRAGLGSLSSNIKQLRHAAKDLMQRYISADTIDLDLVFSSDFTKEERAALHQVAKSCRLASRSYGHDKDNERFLVVRKKLDPFSLVHAVIEKGGNTPKYQVFIPIALGNNRR